jgi:hypothetical protein
LKIKNTVDFYTGLTFFLLALLFIVFAQSEVEVSGLRVVRGHLSPLSCPLFVLYLMAFLALLLTLSSFWGTKKGGATGKVEGGRYLRALWGVVFSVAYVVLMQAIGYLAASMTMLASYIIFMGSRKYVAVILVSIVVPLVLYYVFGELMHVLFP